MYAVVNDRNKQYVVKEGSLIRIDHLDISEGNVLEFNNILMVGDDDKVITNNNELKEMVVKSVVKRCMKADKVVTLKFKRRKHHMKKIGHRQRYVVVEVTYIGNK